MASTSGIENELNCVLHKAAEKLNLKNYSLNLNINVLKGDGFLGEFFKASIVDEDSNTEIHLALKKAPTSQKQREENSIESIYKNEIFFYSEVYPTFLEFEKENNVLKPFGSIPQYITSCRESGKEVIVLKDITFDGFILREKDLLLDDELATFIFKTYGHYHAISFCLKEKKPEVYYNLTKQFVDIFELFVEKDGFQKAFQKITEECYNLLDPENEGDLRKKFKKYVDCTMEIFKESLKYKGKHFGILHGDCWSNNMMFQYKDSRLSKLSEMKLLDFQIIRNSTPIHDLSYFFYTGGCKKLFDNLEHYLNIYYQSFSQSARNLGCNPEVLLPRNILSEEWKIYSKFGMLMSVMLTKVKLISKEDSIEMIEKIGNEENENDEPFSGANYDKNLFNKRVRDILLHMNEIDAL